MLDNSGADLWVVQRDTLGTSADNPTLNDDTYRTILAIPGVSQAANVTYLTMQVRKGQSGCAHHGGRHCSRRVGCYAGMAAVSRRRTPGSARGAEAVVDMAAGFKLGDRPPFAAITTWSSG